MAAIKTGSSWIRVGDFEASQRVKWLWILSFLTSWRAKPRKLPLPRSILRSYGYSILQGAMLQRADTIIALDRDPARLAMAKLFGATHTVDSGSNDVVGQIKALTGGRGADYVIESAGHEQAFRLSPEILRPGGQLVWLGKINVERDVAFRWGGLMGEKRIVRSSYGKLRLDELITRRIRLEEINEGFAAMTRGEIVRAVIVF